MVSVVSSIQSQGGAGSGRRSSCTVKSRRRRYFCRCARVVFGAPKLRVQRATVMCECVVFRGEVKCDVEPVWNRLVTGCNKLSLRTGVEKACRLPQLRPAEPLRLYFGPHRRCPMRSSPASRCAVPCLFDLIGPMGSRLPKSLCAGPAGGQCLVHLRSREPPE